MSTETIAISSLPRVEVKYPHISSDLTELGTSALRRLAPLVDVKLDDAEHPKYRLGQATFYLSSRFDDTVVLKPDDLRARCTYVVGHENGHFLHGKANPEIGQSYGEDMIVTNLMEMVADWCAFALLDDPSYDVKQTRDSVFSKLKKLDKRDRKFLKNQEISHAEYVKSYNWHAGATRAAKYMYDNFGTKYLPEFARANKTQAIFWLINLGYRDSLFLPYRKDEHDVTRYRNGRPQIMTHLHIEDFDNTLVKVVPVSNKSLRER